MVVFRPELEEDKHEGLILKGDMRRAISEREFVLHYQPKVDLSCHCINGVEALVRWQHPTLGLLYPDRFIHLAESSGMMKPMTEEVVRLALEQIRAWDEAGLEIPVAVNISASILQDRDFPDWLAGMLEAFGVESRMLELEVTETALMTEPATAIMNTRRLGELGVQISIDDFGTGYSSMAYLQKLLVAKIKIDKSFVMEMDKQANDEAIVRSTISLAHNLGLKAVAEGVENKESWDRLKDLGCDSAQGYFMSKPLPPEKLEEWLRVTQLQLASQRALRSVA